jgi:hypothetical protein
MRHHPTSGISQRRFSQATTARRPYHGKMTLALARACFQALISFKGTTKTRRREGYRQNPKTQIPENPKIQIPQDETSTDFMFQLNEEEVEGLTFQIGRSKGCGGGGIDRMPLPSTVGADAAKVEMSLLRSFYSAGGAVLQRCGPYGTELLLASGITAGAVNPGRVMLSTLRGGNLQVEKFSFGALRFSFAGFVRALPLIHGQLTRTLANLFPFSGSGPCSRLIGSLFLQIFHHQR